MYYWLCVCVHICTSQHETFLEIQKKIMKINIKRFFPPISCIHTCVCVLPVVLAVMCKNIPCGISVNSVHLYTFVCISAEMATSVPTATVQSEAPTKGTTTGEEGVDFQKVLKESHVLGGVSQEVAMANQTQLREKSLVPKVTDLEEEMDVDIWPFDSVFTPPGIRQVRTSTTCSNIPSFTSFYPNFVPILHSWAPCVVASS